MRPQQIIKNKLDHLYELAQRQETTSDEGRKQFEEYSLAIEVLEWVLLGYDWLNGK